MIYYPEDENPNAATEEAITHESNAVVNNEGGTSETPSNLVGFNFKPGEVVTQEELDRILSYNKDSQLESKLTPNPAGFGFTRQEFVDSLPLAINARPNTLYCLKVKNDNILVGYKLYKFVLTPEGGEFRPFGATPDLDIEDGERATPVQVVTEPAEAPEKVFTGLVGFNKAPIIEGKPLDQWVDSHGGVTEQEARNIAHSVVIGDKEVIEKTDYASSEEQTEITFPDNVYPITFYLQDLEETLYLNYNDETVVNESNQIKGSIDYVRNSITIVISEEVSKDLENDSLIYLPFEGEILPALNWYKILNPQPAGTKLYKHTFSATLVNMVTSETLYIMGSDFNYIDNDNSNPTVSNILTKLQHSVSINGTCSIDSVTYKIFLVNSANIYLLNISNGSIKTFPAFLNTSSSSISMPATIQL